MCGIAGVFRFGDDPITEDQIKLFLCELESRGADATGLAFSDSKGKISLYKSDEAAWNFVRNKKFEDFIEENLTEDTQTVILHTRFATGNANPRNIPNNHPIYSGKGAIIHNGGISNDDELFKELKLERGCQTDSDIIRAIVDEYGLTPKAIKVLNKMHGSCASACLHPDFPNRLMLLRSGSPLEVAKVGTNLMFASTRQAIYLASRPWDQWKNFWVQESKSRIAWIAVQKDSAFIIEREKGLVFHSEFKPCSWYVQPDYSRVRTDYQARQERFNKPTTTQSTTSTTSMGTTSCSVTEPAKPTPLSQASRYIKCRNKDCKTTVMMSKKFDAIPLWELKCPDCNTTLSEKEEKAN